ncbi:type I-C CRISPR-associated protein Cas8c/Csd1 [Streptomyces nigrescens]|uniref:Type I-C CRISPR-associated protein Cas8c/Csd1 n=1 Tax=Streptomyces nigrescens TaxID=1920 RepID=A0A640TQF7_STRNI|nr:type I-C CRISPR-associated protein Cas8c/Csd1 [Streptomyces libani]WAU00030.1 type I-C CRISPR-associated protein Cas8c/Csd1 [Streptomyces libani subsp. libani]GFE25758.1 hypothetical protein Sliba_62110 [Streptomyces libani subsp. libani]GGV98961.1 hypothetical protein GCM10010500_48860 [Streptomyces libani subsp. libani]
MLLHALVEHADRRKDSDTVPLYYQRRQAHWMLNIPSAPGGGPQLIDLRPGKGEERRMITAPYTGRSGSAPKPLLLADNATFTLGMAKRDKGTQRPSEDPKEIDKATARHTAYIQLLTEWTEAHPQLPEVQAVARWSQQPHMSIPDTMVDSEIIGIAVDGSFVHDLPEARTWWAARVKENKSGGGEDGICLVCGHPNILLRTLPTPIKGIPNSGMNTQLVCINQPAHFRAGVKQLGATPICEPCGTKAATALNMLLADPDHHSRAGDAVITWWTVNPETDTKMWTLDDPDPAEVAQLVNGLNHPNQSRTALASIDGDAFYAVTLRVNTNRVIVSDWITIPVPTLHQRLGTWFADQQTWDGWTNTDHDFPIWRLAMAAARWDKRKNKYVDTTIPKNLPADLTKAALRGAPSPAYLLATLMQRIRADHHIDRPRIALLRLTLTRSPATRHRELCMPRLNTESTEPGYVCGRIMAMLEAIQRKAMPKVNATITDKYLSTAVVSPRAALTRLRLGARPHLRTISRKSEPAAAAMEKRLREAFDLLDSLPAHLNAEQQALFVLGYEHQKAHSARAAAEAIKARKEGKELAAEQTADALPDAEAEGDEMPDNALF